jgi:hypothetical protein
MDAAGRVGLTVPRAHTLSHIIREIEEGRRQMDWANLTDIDRAGR